VKKLLILLTLITGMTGMSQEFYISNTGNDLNPGTFEKPFATLFKAQQAVRECSQFRKSPITVQIKEATYYLPKTLIFTAADSGTKAAPVTFQAYKNGEVIISGGMKLNLEWKIFRGGVFQAAVPKGVAIDQLFVNGKRQHMARYPNYNANTVPYNGFAADAFSPERASRWSKPKGGYIHAMHRAHWGGGAL